MIKSPQQNSSENHISIESSQNSKSVSKRDKNAPKIQLPKRIITVPLSESASDDKYKKQFENKVESDAISTASSKRSPQKLEVPKQVITNPFNIPQNSIDKKKGKKRRNVGNKLSLKYNNKENSGNESKNKNKTSESENEENIINITVKNDEPSPQNKDVSKIQKRRGVEIPKIVVTAPFSLTQSSSAGKKKSARSSSNSPRINNSENPSNKPPYSTNKNIDLQIAEQPSNIIQQPLDQEHSVTDSNFTYDYLSLPTDFNEQKLENVLREYKNNSKGRKAPQQVSPVPQPKIIRREFQIQEPISVQSEFYEEEDHYEEEDLFLDEEEEVLEGEYFLDDQYENEESNVYDESFNNYDDECTQSQTQSQIQSQEYSNSVNGVEDEYSQNNNNNSNDYYSEQDTTPKQYHSKHHSHHQHTHTPIRKVAENYFSASGKKLVRLKKKKNDYYPSPTPAKSPLHQELPPELEPSPKGIETRNKHQFASKVAFSDDDTKERTVDLYNNDFENHIEIEQSNESNENEELDENDSNQNYELDENESSQNNELNENESNPIDETDSNDQRNSINDDDILSFFQFPSDGKWRNNRDTYNFFPMIEKSNRSTNSTLSTNYEEEAYSNHSYHSKASQNNSNIGESNNSKISKSSHNSKIESDRNSKRESANNSKIESQHNSRISKSSHNSKIESAHNSKIESAHNSKIESAHNSKIESAHNSKIESAHNSKIESAHNSKLSKSSHNSKVESGRNSKISKSGNSQIDNNESHSHHSSIMNSPRNSQHSLQNENVQSRNIAEPNNSVNQNEEIQGIETVTSVYSQTSPMPNQQPSNSSRKNSELSQRSSKNQQNSIHSTSSSKKRHSQLPSTSDRVDQKTQTSIVEEQKEEPQNEEEEKAESLLNERRSSSSSFLSVFSSISDNYRKDVANYQQNYRGNNGAVSNKNSLLDRSFSIPYDPPDPRFIKRDVKVEDDDLIDSILSESLSSDSGKNTVTQTPTASPNSKFDFYNSKPIDLKLKSSSANVSESHSNIEKRSSAMYSSKVSSLVQSSRSNSVIDYSNRASESNPEDVESLVYLSRSASNVENESEPKRDDEENENVQQKKATSSSRRQTSSESFQFSDRYATASSYGNKVDTRFIKTNGSSSSRIDKTEASINSQASLSAASNNNNQNSEIEDRSGALNFMELHPPDIWEKSSGSGAKNKKSSEQSDSLGQLLNTESSSAGPKKGKLAPLQYKMTNSNINSYNENDNSNSSSHKKKLKNRSIDQFESTSFSVTTNSSINTSKIVEDLSQISHDIELQSDELASSIIQTSSVASKSNASISSESSKSGREKKRSRSKQKSRSSKDLNVNFSDVSDISETSSVKNEITMSDFSISKSKDVINDNSNRQISFNNSIQDKKSQNSNFSHTFSNISSNISGELTDFTFESKDSIMSDI